jgi:hypothetical protein
MCVLIIYGKCFNMLKVDNSIHVACWWLKKCQENH